MWKKRHFGYFIFLQLILWFQLCSSNESVDITNQISSCPSQESDKSSQCHEIGDSNATEISQEELGNERDKDPAATAFVEWLLANGATFPKVFIKQYTGNVRGIHTLEDVQPDELIVQIPKRLLLTSDMGRETDVGKAVESAGLDKVLNMRESTFLVLLLLTDMKNPDSFNKPDYSLMEKDLSNIPVSWDDEKLKWLEGSFTLQHIHSIRYVQARDYELIKEVFPSFSDIATLEEFRWANMFVNSRNTGPTIDGVQTRVLSPLTGLKNHKDPADVLEYYDQSLEAFVLRSVRTIPAGNAICNNYGDEKSNYDFFVYYGFALEEKWPLDFFPLHISLDANDSLLARKQRFWVPNEGAKVYSVYNQPLALEVILATAKDKLRGFKSLLSLSRIAVAKEEDLKKLEALYEGDLRDISESVSTENEKAALEHIKTIVQDYLSKFPRTLEDDERDLKEGNVPLYSDRRHALIHLIGEKRALRNALDLAETGLGCLNAPLPTVFSFISRFLSYDVQKLWNIANSVCSIQVSYT